MKKEQAIIKIRKKNCCDYWIVVCDSGSEKKFKVTLTDVYYNRLTGGKILKEELLENCFNYFVENDILVSLDKRFSLREVGKRFPDFEKDMSNFIGLS
ncbi:MAG: hypothetical protein KAU06_02395 [Candidatus Marinimicrobia bacterium]|nr:hypothetical protein [Candidatus Neomarinimicrobiota bacterium]